MIAGWVVVGAALVYLCLLFAVAFWGDRQGKRVLDGGLRATIYALGLAVYCTSWTFFGSVGLASGSGLDFLAVYLGPILVIGLGYKLVQRIVTIAKAQNITSVADFVAARYGKSERVAAIVSLIAVVGSVPYIALQLKAVSSSLNVFLATDAEDTLAPAMAAPFGDLALLVAVVLAIFAVGFGTRHADATEHQNGLVLAISLESGVKLVAFLMVGYYVTFHMFGGIGDIHARLEEVGRSLDLMERTSSLGAFLTIVLLSGLAILMLPRQFHVSVVEKPCALRCRPRRLAVPALPDPDQHLRGPAGSGRLCDLRAGHHRPGHDRAGPAAGRRRRRDGADCLSRRIVGGDRHGHRRIGGFGHHDLEPPRGPADAASARSSA